MQFCCLTILIFSLMQEVVSAEYELPEVEVFPGGVTKAFLNSNRELHCTVVKGNPVPNITWSRKEGRDLPRNAQIEQRGVLKFKKIDLSAEGEYICTGSNIVGTSSSNSVNIKVYDPPAIIILPKNYTTLQYNEPLEIKCGARGYPTPMVAFIGPQGAFGPQNLGTATLRVSSVTKRDSGTYYCIAHSIAGSAHYIFFVDVKVKADDSSVHTDSPISLNPCKPSPCGPNAVCIDIDHRPSCTCLPKYIGDPPNCKPECTNIDECASHLVCVNGSCIDPCDQDCSNTTECHVAYHLAVCCPVGYDLDPVLSQCVSNKQFNSCFPNPCGNHAECNEANNNMTSCECEEGYFGDPYTVCQPECSDNADCDADKVCKNLECKDACENSVCATEAECKGVDHTPICTCNAGLTGDAYTECFQELNEDNLNADTSVKVEAVIGFFIFVTLVIGCIIICFKIRAKGNKNGTVATNKKQIQFDTESLHIYETIPENFSVHSTSNVDDFHYDTPYQAIQKCPG